MLLFLYIQINYMAVARLLNSKFIDKKYYYWRYKLCCFAGGVADWLFVRQVSFEIIRSRADLFFIFAATRLNLAGHGLTAINFGDFFRQRYFRNTKKNVVFWWMWCEKVM